VGSTNATRKDEMPTYPMQMPRKAKKGQTSSPRFTGPRMAPNLSSERNSTPLFRR